MTTIKSQESIQGYFYGRQIKGYIGMFMAAFQGLQVQTGKRGDGEIVMLDVPVQYGSKDRVAAAIVSENTQNKMLRLPIMSVYMRNMNLDVNRMKGTGYERNTPHVPQGGILPDDVRNIKQRMPVPYTLDMELTIYTSNEDQQYQIIEQIAMLFDPSIQLERSDSPFDWAKNVTVTMEELNLDENYPAGAERRKIQCSIRFSMPVWIESPATYKNDLVKEIKLRIQAMSDLSELADSITSASDDDYFTVADAEDIRGLV